MRSVAGGVFFSHCDHSLRPSPGAVKGGRSIYLRAIQASARAPAAATMPAASGPRWPAWRARAPTKLARVTNSAGISPDALDDVAARIAILEVQDPQVARALRALAPRRRPITQPPRRPRHAQPDPNEDEDPQ